MCTIIYIQINSNSDTYKYTSNPFGRHAQQHEREPLAATIADDEIKLLFTSSDGFPSRGEIRRREEHVWDLATSTRRRVRV
jgi:hypothetical protein